MNLSKKLIALAMALGPLVPTAIGQPAQTCGDWGVRIGKSTKAGHLSVRLGSRGVGVDLAAGRNYRTRQRSVGHQHGSCCNFVPGHYEARIDRVWVPGATEQVWVPAQYQVSYNACGQRIQTLVAPARWEYINHPGRYENRQVRVWIPGSYRCGGGGITPYPAGRRWR
jgi:hypothetical protein